MKELGLAGNVERVEIIVKKGVPIEDNDLKIAHGYLIRISDGKPVEIDGFRNLFVRVIEV